MINLPLAWWEVRELELTNPLAHGLSGYHPNRGIA